MQISENIKAVSGVISDGFVITQFPAARAGAIFHVKDTMEIPGISHRQFLPAV